MPLFSPKSEKAGKPHSPLGHQLSEQLHKASETTMKGWEKFQNWDRNHDYLHTVCGLLSIAFCLNWALAGATLAFVSSEHTAVVKSLSDAAITKTWNLMDIKQQSMVLAAGIFMAVFGNYVSFLLFPIQIVASITAFKLGMDLALKNIKIHDEEEVKASKKKKFFRLD